MAHATLVFTEHRDMGYRGWRLKRHPLFEPVEARGVAHDLLEHAPNDSGRVIEEMRALGAFTFTRIESGLLYEEYRGGMTVGEMLGEDILTTFRGALTMGYNGSHLNEKASRWRLLGNDRYEDEFREAVAYARSHWAQDMTSDDGDEVCSSYFSGHGEAVILTALRAGFRWAERRYEDPYRAATLFRRVEQGVARVTPDAELDDEIVVHYGLQSLDVRVNHRDAYGFERW